MTTTTRSMDTVSIGEPLRLVRLWVAASPEQARPQVVTIEGALQLGRGRDGPLPLADDAISRTHAVVEVDAHGGLSLRDLGSRNGTFLRGERIDSAPLVDGDVVRIGDTLLVVQVLTIDPREPLAPEAAGVLGPSVAMQRVRGLVDLAAKTSLPVLIEGETGVGKERVATAIHARSGRRGRFVAINCGAIAEGVAESELFGHAAGAFTGAAKAREGLFESSHEGTLFLDEIGELPKTLQAKLLRVLSTGEVRRVGSDETRKVDVRVVAATLRDLDGEVARDAFREDLLARLTGFRIHVPPLRSRKEDVLPLAESFLGGGKISPDAAEALLLWSYPQNVRELEQIVAAAIARGTSPGIELDQLPRTLAAPLSARRPKRASAPPLEILVDRSAPPSADDLRLVLARMQGNVSRVAEFFGKDRQQVYRWARRFGIELRGREE
jgi:transcriptional regulator with GAF, ATPase, and Fis domain